MTDMAEFPPEPEGWLPPQELEYIRAHLPMVYVDIVPVRVDEAGSIAEVGLVLRAYDDAMIRALVSGPFMIAEYFPTKGVGPFHDSRQHAVSLAFVVPVDGECEARQDALDIVWLTPEEATSEEIGAEMHGGQDVILRRGLASHEAPSGL
jgi:hypothetical protein